MVVFIASSAIDWGLRIHQNVYSVVELLNNYFHFAYISLFYCMGQIKIARKLIMEKKMIGWKGIKPATFEPRKDKIV